MNRISLCRMTSRTVWLAAILAVGLAMKTDEPTNDEANATPSTVDPASRLTPQQINRVRFMELRASCARNIRPTDIPVDRVVVRIPSQTIKDFLAWKQGTPDYEGEAAHRRFMRRTPPGKLAEIAYWARDSEDELKWADRVEIRTDPEALVEFRRQIQPLLISGCASSACHGGTALAEVKVRFYNDPARSDRTTYANFITLREITIDGHRMIDTNTVEDSLFLNYMLREDLTRIHHPGRRIKPVYQTRTTTGYRLIARWIESLRSLDAEKLYGFRLLPRRAATETPDKPDADSTRAP